MAKTMQAGNDSRSKGKVGVGCDRGRLRLILPRHLFDGKTKYIYLDLTDSPKNRRIAKGRAIKIEEDIDLDLFDYSLNRYKKDRSPAQNVIPKIQLTMTLSSIYEEYIHSKKHLVRPSTWNSCYLYFWRLIQKSPVGHIKLGNKPLAIVEPFCEWIERSVPPETGKRLCQQVDAAFRWAIAKGLVIEESLPFKEFARKIRTANKTATKPYAEIDPFSIEERDAIIKAFSKTPYYNYVRFLFYTGCRPCEAIGLTWDNVATDLSRIVFRKVVIRGLGGQPSFCDGLKTQKSRTFPCNKSVKEILQDTKTSTSTEIVFPSPKGKIMSTTNFRRAWVRIISSLKISYRKPYNTRHTFITLCLENGLDAKDVAKLVGNSPEVIYKHYAGARSNLIVPDF